MKRGTIMKILIDALQIKYKISKVKARKIIKFIQTNDSLSNFVFSLNSIKNEDQLNNYIKEINDANL